MTALGPLTLVLALVYFAAAALHAGLAIPLVPVTFEPSQPATVAETIIGVALSVAAVMVTRAGPSRAVWGLYGRGGPDLWVHFVMLAGLAACFALLIGARGRPRSI